MYINTYTYVYAHTYLSQTVREVEQASRASHPRVRTQALLTPRVSVCGCGCVGALVNR